MLFKGDTDPQARILRLGEASADSWAWRLEESKLLQDFNRRLLALEVAADLRGSKLRGQFRGSNLNGSNLAGASLEGDLTGASFQGADLRYATLSDNGPEPLEITFPGDSAKRKGLTLRNVILKGS